MFENENFLQVITQKDFKKLANYGVSLSKMMSEAHPSQGNYVAMISGSNLGIVDDKNYDLNQNHVGDLLEKANMKWKVYAEDYPGNCFTGATFGFYARKHVPFLSFTNVTRNPERCKNIEDTSHFLSDYNSSNLAEFSMFIPNLKNDGHNSGLEYAGKWLTQNFASILSKPENLGETLFIITFDESGKSPINQIYTVLIGSQIIENTTNTQNLNHISLLKMIEDEFKLGTLNREDSRAQPIQNIWK